MQKLKTTVSRKTHTGVSDFDINLPLTGTPGIECRTGPTPGEHKVVISFPASVTFTSAAVTTGVGVASATGSGTSTVTVNLSGVSNAQTIIITLFNVSDGTNSSSVGIPMSLLAGDVNFTSSVSGSDVNLCKAQVGLPVSASNFQNDINTTGSISGSDVNLTKAQVGTNLP